VSKTVRNYCTQGKRAHEKNKLFKIRIEDRRNRATERHIQYIVRHFDSSMFSKREET
jgi:hypothetical protein